jgi:hypothetical protein
VCVCVCARAGRSDQNCDPYRNFRYPKHTAVHTAAAYNGKRQVPLRQFKHKPTATSIEPPLSSEPGGLERIKLVDRMTIGHIYVLISVVCAVFCQLAMVVVHSDLAAHFKAIVFSKSPNFGQSEPNRDCGYARVGTQPIGVFSTSLAGFFQPQLPTLWMERCGWSLSCRCEATGPL